MTPFVETTRKRAAFLRKQRLEREAFPLFASDIAAGQHDVEREMACRALRWEEWQKTNRAERAARWRKARARLFSFPDDLRQTIRNVWRSCPYPADPASFADFLHQIAVGRLDPHRPPWVFHPKTAARITTNPDTFSEAFRRIGHKQMEGHIGEDLLFCGNLGAGILFLWRRVRVADPAGASASSFDPRLVAAVDRGAGEWVEIEVRGACPDAHTVLIEQLAQAAETRPVVVQRIGTVRSPESERVEGVSMTG
ncbi:hypothetical protein [Bosea sp. MMO-172]|uniref:hypothetical protein n=1 Tax=Bosea sp. MMO-172 TaxID=3127885 RepID=UPI00301A5672